MGAEADAPLTLDSLASELEGLYNDDGTVAGDPPSPPPQKEATPQSPPKDTVQAPLATEPKTTPNPDDDGDGDDDDDDGSGQPPAQAAAPDGQQPDGQQPDGAAQALPQSIEELAQALEIDPAQLLSLKVKTKIDGQDGEVTLAEAIKSYQLEGHINKKSMALTEERKAWEQQVHRVNHGLQSQVQQLSQAQELLKAMLWGEYGNVDWNRLVEDDPDEYQRKYLGYQQRYGQLKLVQETLAQHTQQAQQAARTQYEAYLNEQRRELANRMPAWNDAKAKANVMNELDEYLQSAYGLRPNTVHTLDHWSGPVIAWKALQYDKLQKETAAVKQKVQSAPRFAKPGTARPSQAPTHNEGRIKNLRQQMAKPSGSTDALAAFLLETGQV